MLDSLIIFLRFFVLLDLPIASFDIDLIFSVLSPKPKLFKYSAFLLMFSNRSNSYSLKGAGIDEHSGAVDVRGDRKDRQSIRNGVDFYTQ